VAINARHELILIRARNSNTYIIGDPAQSRRLNYSQRRMPHVALNEVNKLFMLRALETISEYEFPFMGFV